MKRERIEQEKGLREGGWGGGRLVACALVIVTDKYWYHNNIYNLQNS